MYRGHEATEYDGTKCRRKADGGSGGHRKPSQGVLENFGFLDILAAWILHLETLSEPFKSPKELLVSQEIADGSPTPTPKDRLGSCFYPNCCSSSLLLIVGKTWLENQGHFTAVTVLGTIPCHIIITLTELQKHS